MRELIVTNLVRLIGIFLVMAGGAVGYDGPAHRVGSWEWFGYIALVVVGLLLYGAGTQVRSEIRKARRAQLQDTLFAAYDRAKQQSSRS